MSIGKKLSLLTAVVVVSVIVISSVFISTLWSLDRIEKERMILSRLARSASEFTALVNSLDSNQMDGIRERFDAAAKNLDAAFEAAGTITVLPRSSAELAKAMQTIEKLRPLVKETESTISADYDVLAVDVKRYFYSTASNGIMNFYTSDYVRKKYDLTEVYGHLESFFTAVMGASGTMDAVSTTIAEQEAIIDAAIQERQRSGIVLSIVIALVLSLAVAVYTRIISTSIRSRVRLIDESLRPIGEGNLREKIPTDGNDEIARIAVAINTLVGDLGNLIRTMKENVGTLRDKGGDLSSRMEETSSSILGINSRIADTKSHLESQSGAVTATASSADRLVENTGTLDDEIRHQVRVIEQSSASIEEMIANIAALSSTTGKVDSAASDLVNLAETGRERIDSVSLAIRGINDSSESLIAAAKIINNIASQTNLLAMNAAIEAAHAGETGLGFAVVADEIRNLANQSAVQAKRVATDLKSVKASLQHVASLSDDSQSTFHDILERVRSVRDLIGGVGIALQEQNSGSADLLSGIGDLRSITARVTDAGSAMRSANEDISDSIVQLKDSTELVNGNNAGILVGTGEINDSVHAILRMAEENRALINTLETETARFIID